MMVWTPGVLGAMIVMEKTEVAACSSRRPLLLSSGTTGVVATGTPST